MFIFLSNSFVFVYIAQLVSLWTAMQCFPRVGLCNPTLYCNHLRMAQLILVFLNDTTTNGVELFPAIFSRWNNLRLFRPCHVKYCAAIYLNQVLSSDFASTFIKLSRRKVRNNLSDFNKKQQQQQNSIKTFAS